MRDVTGRGAQRIERIRIEIHADFPIDAADAGNRAHAWYRAQLATDREIDEPRQLRRAHCRGGHSVSQNRTAGRCNPGNDRVFYLGRQRGANAAYSITNVVHGLLCVAVELEFDSRQ